MLTSTDRTAWHQVVADIAAKAHEKLPESNGRIESAVKLILAGDAELLPDGAAMVASRSQAGTEYALVNGVCECRAYAHAPHHFCAHRLAAAILRRAQELTPPQEELPVQDEEPAEVAAGIDPRHIVRIQGRPFVKF